MRPPAEADFQSGGIRDQGELELAHDGPDWSCFYCGSNNRASEASCNSCGSGRDGRKQPRKAPTPKPSAAHASTAPRGKGRKPWGVLVGIVVSIICVVCWLTVDRDYDGTVTSIHWAHTTKLQRWQNTTRADWRTSLSERAEVPPQGGRGEVAGLKISHCYEKHHHDESYACGTETYQGSESYTCGSTQSCTDVNNGNGSFSRRCVSVSKTCERAVTRTRTKYCSRPVTASWCDYVTQEWATVEREVVAGAGHDGLYFAKLSAHGNSERVVEEGRYTIVCVYDDEEETYSVEVTKAEYDQWQVGTAVIVAVDHLHGATGVRRK